MTTKTTHTPGPWSVQELETQHHGYDWQTFAIRSPQNVCLAIVGEVDRFESERIPANARLIAMAPRMLVALQKLATAAEHRENTMGDPCRLLECKANLESAAKEACAILHDLEGESV